SADNLAGHYLAAAAEMGRAIAHAGIRLVYGAGKTGLMGAVADGALSAGGEVIGITPENLNTSALIHSGLTRLEVTRDIHQRKARMAELADGFIALPGGLGTLDEMFEALTWNQIGIHRKPVGILNTAGYYDLILAFMEKARSEHFIYAEHMQLFVSSAQPADLLEKLQSFTWPEALHRWVER
ncbi:MAG TPA: TIGR00730 family Rossman fold protein, partial [Anaerolineaceae bacterium]|nr:TIGR00730 family Rossman fold protein [Anaerolineaceae bacterium]